MFKYREKEEGIAFFVPTKNAIPDVFSDEKKDIPCHTIKHCDEALYIS